MENTIMTHDRLIALRTAYWFSEPKRGDIVVFHYPDNEEEPYIKEPAEEDFGPYQVPKESYFMLGDNRNHSGDSRDWENTYVKKNKILGKAFLRYYPNFKKFS